MCLISNQNHAQPLWRLPRNPHLCILSFLSNEDVLCVSFIARGSLSRIAHQDETLWKQRTIYQLSGDQAITWQSKYAHEQNPWKKICLTLTYQGIYTDIMTRELGTFKQGKLNGPGKIIREQGGRDDIVEEGEFVDGKLIRGRITYPHGYKEEGTFNDGKLSQGKKAFYYGLVYEEEGTFGKDGKLNGKGKRILMNEDVQEGVFEFGKLVNSASSTSSSSVTTSTSPPSAIFLDIDGVLYGGAGNVNLIPKLRELFPTIDPRGYTSYHYDTAATHYFSATAIGHLESLIRKIPNVIIVLSSNWREGRTPSQLREIFAKHAFSHLIIDKTPDQLDKEYCKAYAAQEVGDRAREIAYWLEKHPEIKNFVILDDCDSGLSETFSKQFVHINRGLLSEEHISLAATILNSAVIGTGTSSTGSTISVNTVKRYKVSEVKQGDRRTENVAKVEDFKPSLQDEFDSLKQSYMITIRVTSGCGTRAQQYIDSAYEKLTEFTEAHPEFVGQLPKKYGAYDDGTGGVATGLATLVVDARRDDNCVIQ